jgi:hypothetical protein
MTGTAATIFGRELAVGLERNEQAKAFDVAVAALRAKRDRWAIAGELVIPDA